MWFSLHSLKMYCESLIAVLGIAAATPLPPEAQWEVPVFRAFFHACELFHGVK